VTVAGKYGTVKDVRVRYYLLIPLINLKQQHN